MNEMNHDYEIAKQVLLELGEAREKWPDLHSGHEAYAVIKEELDEFWIEVQANKGDPAARRLRMKKELIQVAAMAIRAIVDVSLPIFNEDYKSPEPIRKSLESGTK